MISSKSEWFKMEERKHFVIFHEPQKDATEEMHISLGVRVESGTEAEYGDALEQLYQEGMVVYGSKFNVPPDYTRRVDEASADQDESKLIALLNELDKQEGE